MGGYSCDKDGIVEFRDENNRLLFSKPNSVAVAGWSNHPHISGKFKNINESTGKADTKDK